MVKDPGRVVLTVNATTLVSLFQWQEGLPIGRGEDLAHQLHPATTNRFLPHVGFSLTVNFVRDALVQQQNVSLSVRPYDDRPSGSSANHLSP